MGKSTVKNLSNHSVDLEPSGRVVEPGEIVKQVDLDNDHNKALLDAGKLMVIKEQSSKEGDNK